jgi:hypothetical protein
MQDWIDDMKKLLESKTRDKTKIKQCFKEIYVQLMDHRGIRSQDGSLSLYDGTSTATQIGMGPYRKRFAQVMILLSSCVTSPNDLTGIPERSVTSHSPCYVCAMTSP